MISFNEFKYLTDYDDFYGDLYQLRQDYKAFQDQKRLENYEKEQNNETPKRVLFPR